MGCGKSSAAQHLAQQLRQRVDLGLGGVLEGRPGLPLGDLGMPRVETALDAAAAGDERVQPGEGVADVAVDGEVRQMIADAAAVGGGGHALETDLGPGAVAERGEALAEQHGLSFFETSAKNGINVNEVFNHIARVIVSEKLPPQTASDGFSNANSR